MSAMQTLTDVYPYDVTVTMKNDSGAQDFLDFSVHINKMEQWLRGQNIKYGVIYNKYNEVTFSFKKSSHAMIFKMMWC